MSIRACRSGSPPGFSLANGLYGLLVLPELLPPRTARARSRGGAPIRSARCKLLRSHPRLLGLASVNFLGNLAHASLPSIGVLYMMYPLRLDERTVGFTMAGVGVCAMVVQGGLIGPTVKRFGERATLIMGLVFGIAGFATWGWRRPALFFWLGIPLMALWGFANAASLGLMSRLVGPSEQGQLQGANASLMGIANLIGPVLFTQTFALFIGAAQRLAFAGRAVPAGGAAAGLRCRRRVAHDAVTFPLFASPGNVRAAERLETTACFGP